MNLIQTPTGTFLFSLTNTIRKSKTNLSDMSVVGVLP